MPREISAGGVVLRQISGVWHVALIEPQKNEPQKESPRLAKTPRKRSRALLTLPKGLVDAGEKPQAAAVREVQEETGIVAEPVTKLCDNKYVYVRTWGDGARVFKIVSFYLMRYVFGRNRQPHFRHADRSQASSLGAPRRRSQTTCLQQRAQGAAPGAGLRCNTRPRLAGCGKSRFSMPSPSRDGCFRGLAASLKRCPDTNLVLSSLLENPLKRNEETG